MKYMNYILSVFLVPLFILSSCQNETLIDAENAPLQFALNVKGGFSTTRSENVTDTVRVYVYNAAGNPETDRPIFSLNKVFDGNDNILYYSPENDFNRNASYNVFAVAAKNNIVSVNESPTQKNLLDLVHSTTFLTDGEHIVAGGIRGVTFNNPSKFISLIRTNCQLVMQVSDKTVGKVFKAVTVSLETPDKAYVFPSEVRNSTDIPSDAGNTQKQLTMIKENDGDYASQTYNFFENPTGLILNIQAVRDGVNGDETFTYRVELAKTERNTIYRVTAGLNLTGLTVDTNTLLDWTIAGDDNQELTPGQNP